MDVHRQDPIRIRRLTVTNFRTFQGRVDIALGQGDRADAVAVFLGDNGTGKSTAFAALAWLEWRPNNALESLASPWDASDGPAAVRLSRRDWPPGVSEPMEVEVEFTNPHLPAPAVLKARCSQAGSAWNLDLQRAVEGAGFGSIPRDPALCARLRNALEAPNGFRRAFAKLDARRTEWHASQLVDELFLMSTSRDAAERQRWRRFAELVGQFPSLRGKEVSAEPSASLNSRDLVFEERGRLLLGLGESVGVSNCVSPAGLGCGGVAGDLQLAVLVEPTRRSLLAKSGLRPDRPRPGEPSAAELPSPQVWGRGAQPSG
jgi:hypothetical protein